jgi:hypothetical protein
VVQDHQPNQDCRACQADQGGLVVQVDLLALGLLAGLGVLLGLRGKLRSSNLVQNQTPHPSHPIQAFLVDLEGLADPCHLAILWVLEDQLDTRSLCSWNKLVVDSHLDSDSRNRRCV